MYIFVIITILSVAFGTSTIAYTTGADQIDRYYKQNTADNARNFASMVDGDFLRELRRAAESEEFQAIRNQAEENDDEAPVEQYLREKGLWDRYSDTRDRITAYLENMKGIKYLYIVAHGDKNAEHDMYLVDDKENPIYETGYYEEREAELRGVDIANLPEPTISHGDWGWLCSDFKPVFDSDGKCVCIVGCDIGMDDVMAERQRLLLILVAGVLIFTYTGTDSLLLNDVPVLPGAYQVMLQSSVLKSRNGQPVYYSTIITPLHSMTDEMKKFTPSENLSYQEAGVIDLNIKSHDEINEIYQGIRDMQIHIIDYLKDKQKAEKDLRHKDEQIDQLSIETYKDALTGVGNKAAYLKRVGELNRQQTSENLEYAIVMVDINNLKAINDEHGHRAGDQYIKGCCHMICEVFKHSPVYRIGGDEFAVLLQGSDYVNRKELCEQLRADYERTSAQRDFSPWLRYSAAVGMAEKAADDNSVELVFRRADEAMYRDKVRIKKQYGQQPR